MDKLLQQLLTISITSSLAIVFMLIVRRRIQRYIHPKWSQWLWTPIIFQLILPIPIVSEYSVYQPVSTVISKLPQIQSLPEVIGTLTPFKSNNSVNWLMIIYFMGLVGFILYYIIQSVFLLRIKKERIADYAQSDIQSWMRDIQVNRPINVFSVDNRVPLMTYGLWKSHLLVPKWVMELENKQRKILVYHELMHIKNHHSLYNLLLVSLRCIYWFNPLILLMTRAIRLDMEILVDHQVVSQTLDKNSYVHLLIQAKTSKRQMLASAFTSSQTKKQTKERIYMIMKRKSMYPLIVIIPITLVILLLILPKQIQAKSFLFPVHDPAYTCRYGCYTGHDGLDMIDKGNNLEVMAIEDGIITNINKDFGKGLYIVIEHKNGYVSEYRHLASVSVVIGNIVAKGQTIGQMGSTGRSTGVHLHLSITYQGKAVDPIILLSK